MLSSLLTVFLTLSVLTTAFNPSLSLEGTQSRAPLIRAGVTAHHSSSISRHVKRQDDGETELDNQRLGTTYTIDIDIGTPPQTVGLILDTGSFELWVNPVCGASAMPDYCDSFPRFDETKSSSLNSTGKLSMLSYGQGQAVVEYVKDVVSIGSIEIPEQVFGIGLTSKYIFNGILGLSPPLRGDVRAEYKYVLDSMVENGLIESRAFSLDLRGVDNPHGSIIFGGIDTGKYVGSLEKLPMLKGTEIPGGGDRYWVKLVDLGLTQPNGESTFFMDADIPVFLDSGCTLSSLPDDLFFAFGAAFPTAVFDLQEGLFTVQCDVRNMKGSVDFILGGKVISVPFEDFIWESVAGSSTCVLGIARNNVVPVLGDTFLRAAYAVFDQDNRNIHIAQAAHCGSNLVAISSGKDAVPSVTGDCAAPTPAVNGVWRVA